MAEVAAQQNIDDLQIISLNDPNIKEVVGADAIAGRAYHVGNGKVVIVAENLQDFADAMGTIAEEGRHIYHRNSNGLEDSEDYASFYGRQFERYFNKRAKDTPLYMIGSNLAYNAGQLGNDWENDVYWMESKIMGAGHVAVMIVNDRYPNGRVYSWSAIGPDGMNFPGKLKEKKVTIGDINIPYYELKGYGSLYITSGKNFLLGRYGSSSGKIHKIVGSKAWEQRIVDYFVKFIEGKPKKDVIKYDLKHSKNSEGVGSYYEYIGKERPYNLFFYNCVTVGLDSLYHAHGLSLKEFLKSRNFIDNIKEHHTYFLPASSINNPILKGKTHVIHEYKGAKLGNNGYSQERQNEINRIIEKLRKDSGVKK